MKYILSCQHTGHADLPELREYMTCPVCSTRRRLLAVETREYHIKCDDCRFSRWCGQDEPGARRTAARHNANHVVHIDYQSVTDVKLTVRGMFSRKVRTVIDSAVSLKFDPAIFDRILPVQSQGSLDVRSHDVPPF